MEKGTGVPFAFVSTNSICAGRECGHSSGPCCLIKYGLEIAFAHQTFAWGSEARGKAAVHVIVLGLEPKGKVQVDRTFVYLS